MELPVWIHMRCLVLVLELFCGMSYIAGAKQGLSLSKDPIEWIAPYFFSFSPFVLLGYLLYEVSHIQ